MDDFFLLLLVLRNEFLGFIVWIPADPISDGKVIAHRNTDDGAKLHSLHCLPANSGTNLSLKQIDEALGDAAPLSIQRDALVALKCADHELLLPPILLQARSQCSRSHLGIN